MPDVREVSGQVARDDENGVDPHVLTVRGVAGKERVRRRDDPAEPPVVERELRRVDGGALLYLDLDDGAPAFGDQVDFAAAHFREPRQDPPAVEAQPPGRDRLGPPPTLLGRGAVQASPPSSSARA